MKECILDSKNYLHLKTYNYIIYISNPWINLKPFHIIVIRQACQSRFTGLSASRIGLTQTFSYYCYSPSLPVPIHGTVCFPYWTYSNLFKFLVIRQACQSRFTGLSASRTGLTQTFSTVPMLETVGIFYFFANSSKLDLLFNKKSFQLC